MREYNKSEFQTHTHPPPTHAYSPTPSHFPPPARSAPSPSPYPSRTSPPIMPCDSRLGISTPSPSSSAADGAPAPPLPLVLMRPLLSDARAAANKARHRGTQSTIRLLGERLEPWAHKAATRIAVAIERHRGTSRAVTVRSMPMFRAAFGHIGVGGISMEQTG